MKGLLLSVTAASICFFLGYQFCKSMNAELIDAQNAALELAEEVMDKNNLWDKDSTATMKEYIDYSLAVDSLYRTHI